jgi:hypothetical protein
MTQLRPDTLPSDWIDLLQRIAAADKAGLDLDGGLKEDIVRAEHLTDLG